jgi:hypothetical protein
MQNGACHNPRRQKRGPLIEARKATRTARDNHRSALFAQSLAAEFAAPRQKTAEALPLRHSADPGRRKAGDAGFEPATARV